mmetsp:Transcript_63134/g.126705  ORF Transcript_63134/g.126705 Transcript_63134/m.126705 type:complete len:115 (+) Transcript_63134:1182-1526(+)
MNAHWTYLAKRGMAWGYGVGEKLDLAVGFVIEGREESELPEVLLGCVATRFVPMQECVAIDELSKATQVFERQENEEKDEDEEEEESCLASFLLSKAPRAFLTSTTNVMSGSAG